MSSMSIELRLSGGVTRRPAFAADAVEVVALDTLDRLNGIEFLRVGKLLPSLANRPIAYRGFPRRSPRWRGRDQHGHDQS
jgi:hypothetical protein